MEADEEAAPRTPSANSLDRPISPPIEDYALRMPSADRPVVLHLTVVDDVVHVDLNNLFFRDTKGGIDDKEMAAARCRYTAVPSGASVQFLELSITIARLQSDLLPTEIAIDKEHSWYKMWKSDDITDADLKLGAEQYGLYGRPSPNIVLLTPANIHARATHYTECNNLVGESVRHPPLSMSDVLERMLATGAFKLSSQFAANNKRLDNLTTELIWNAHFTSHVSKDDIERVIYSPESRTSWRYFSKLLPDDSDVPNEDDASEKVAQAKAYMDNAEADGMERCGPGTAGKLVGLARWMKKQ
eukprot:gene21192-28092_t